MAEIRVTRRPISERLLEKIEVLPNGCWQWKAGIDPGGYGRFQISKYVSGRAHRVAYVQFVGEIPDGLELDHICHDPKTCSGGKTCPHRSCVNPGHLVACTRAQNASASRKRRNSVEAQTKATIAAAEAKKSLTHCAKGHEFTPKNTRVHLGRRACRTCRALYAREYRKLVKAQATT